MKTDFIKSIVTTMLLFSWVVLPAQTNVQSGEIVNNQPFKIVWVNQFPLPKEQLKTSFITWLSNFIFGKKYSEKIMKPMDVLAINPNLYYVLDQANGSIFNITNNELKLPKVFKKNKVNLSSLVSFCAISKNTMLFTDSRLNKIFKFNTNQKQLNTFNTETPLNQPTGIAYSSMDKTIWVVETAAHRISVLDEEGQRIKTIGKRGKGSGEFNFPTSISIDKSGRVYVVDAMNFRVQVFNSRGEVLSIFGDIGNASGYFARPKGISTDSYGNIYVVDALFNAIQVFDITGKFLYQFGEQGRNKEQFWMPSGIYIDENNYIYIADSYNSRIQIFQLVNGD